jgi:hypothetical protein
MAFMSGPPDAGRAGRRQFRYRFVMLGIIHPNVLDRGNAQDEIEEPAFIARVANVSRLFDEIRGFDG